ncbi:hypothetical protein BVY04_04405, partial [bacterium M21]
RKTTSVLTEEMKGSEHRILAQGITGSRESITETFRKDISSVLMGTHSFWEGVDVVGEALSCVVIARLPFAVFTDPIIEARCEQIERKGGNAFLDFSVPNAVIRFRQGFGRLIRHRSDRGIVIIADRRLITKRYGSWFYGSLPLQCLTYGSEPELLQAIQPFLR